MMKLVLLYSFSLACKTFAQEEDLLIDKEGVSAVRGVFRRHRYLFNHNFLNKDSLVDTCDLPSETGPCLGNFKRWYHDNGECKNFVYGGCDGNENRFESLKECEEACGVEPQTCNLPSVKGTCNGEFTKWFHENGVCKSFSYGGCRGNGNNFNSQTECSVACDV